MSAWIAEFRVDEFPFLADHRLGGAIILPGAAVIEMALAAATAATGRPSYALDDVRFEQICVVTEIGRRRLRVVLFAGPDGGLALTVTSDPGSASGAAHSAPIATYATARITVLAEPATAPCDMAEQAAGVRRAGTESSGEAFYTRLRAAGNDYGPAFRGIQRVWRRGDEAFAIVHAGPAARADQPAWLTHTVVVDAAVQVLAAAARAEGRAFVWVGCAQIRRYETLGADCEAYAHMLPGTESDQIAGDVVVLGSSGQVTAEITGIRLDLLQTGASHGGGELVPPARRPLTLAVAATFAAEPMSAELNAWMATLGTSARVVVEPGQGTVAELTGPGGLLASNRDGVNVLLVRTDEVYGDIRQREGGISGKRFTLPGIGEIAHLHDYETEFLYDEIFVHHAYLGHGVTLHPGDIVFDVGANIGMFTLFVQHRFPGVRVYAFEPAKPAFEVLNENVSRYCPGGEAFNYAISDGDRTLPFTFYSNSTVFSGFAADPERDAKTIRTVIENVLHSKVPPGSIDLRPIVDRLLRDRMVADIYPCTTRTLSSVLRQTGTPRIDLLKIDTEGSEIQVLQGIEGSHWERIRQVVLEVHNRGDACDVVTALLEDRGFRVLVDQPEQLLRGTTLTTVFARRPDDRSGPVPEEPSRTRVTGPPGRRTAHLVQAVETLRRQTNSPCIVCLCPSPYSEGEPDSELRQRVDNADREFAAVLAPLPHVAVVTGAEIDQLHREVGVGPDSFFAALAKAVARAYLGLRR